MTQLNEALWRRVEAELDARRDPLRDDDLRRALESEPATLAAARRLMARLKLLSEPTPASAPAGTVRHTARVARVARAAPRATGRRAVMAAGLLALAGATALMLRAERPDRDPAKPRSTVAAVDPARVSLVVEVEQRDEADRERDPIVLETRSLISWNLEER